jgi:hypothetical protein
VRVSAGPAGRKSMPAAARDFVRRRVCAIVSDPIDAGLRNRVTCLIFVSHQILQRKLFQSSRNPPPGRSLRSERNSCTDVSRVYYEKYIYTYSMLSQEMSAETGLLIGEKGEIGSPSDGTTACRHCLNTIRFFG